MMDSGAEQGLHMVVSQTGFTLTLCDLTVSLQHYAEHLHLFHLLFAGGQISRSHLSSSAHCC